MLATLPKPKLVTAFLQPWFNLMTDIKEEISPRDGRYPQINLNTGVSLATVALLIGMVVWSVDLRGSVTSHDLRITVVEGAVKDLRAIIDATKSTQSEAAVKLEGRLVQIETLLRSIDRRLDDPSRRRDAQP